MLENLVVCSQACWRTLTDATCRGWENDDDEEEDAAMDTLSTLSGPTDNLDKQFAQFRSQQQADEVRERALQEAETRRQQELVRLEEERVKALELAEKQRQE